MKIFVGYGYNPRDQWIEELAIPLIQTFDFSVVSGKGLESGVLRDEVTARIEGARAAVGFATRRDEKLDGHWTTHRWVSDELTYADSLGRRTLEIRENGVEDQVGLRDGIGRLHFDGESRETLLVALAKVMQRWRRELQQVRLQLLPAGIQSKIVPLYRKPGFMCTYRARVAAEEQEQREVRPIPIKGGLFIELRDLPEHALVQVEISYDGKSLTSGFEAIDAPGITLQGDL